MDMGGGTSVSLTDSLCFSYSCHKISLEVNLEVNEMVSAQAAEESEAFQEMQKEFR